MFIKAEVDNGINITERLLNLGMKCTSDLVRLKTRYLEEGVVN